MSKYHSPGRWALSTSALGMAIGIGIGVNIAHNDQAEDVKSLKKANTVVVEYTGMVEEANRNYARVEKNIGEGCLALVRLYLPDGTLSSTPEDSVVSDLTSIPNKPCGNTQPEVRSAFRGLHSAHKGIAAAEAERAKAVTIVQTAEASVDDPDWPDGILFGSLGGMILVGVGGFMTLMIVDGSNRMKGYYERPSS